MNKYKNNTFNQSYHKAIEGIFYALKTEKNIRFHFLAALGVILAASFLHVKLEEFIVLLLAIAMVIATELLNTAIENAVDLSCDRYHPLAKAAKDVAAGAVLLTALISAIIGVLVFGKYIIAIYS
jgi:diacylglycerol kinase (ATP)